MNRHVLLTGKKQKHAKYAAKNKLLSYPKFHTNIQNGPYKSDPLAPKTENLNENVLFAVKLKLKIYLQRVTTLEYGKIILIIQQVLIVENAA